jgi:hypothetical protein
MVYSIQNRVKASRKNGAAFQLEHSWPLDSLVFVAKCHAGDIALQRRKGARLL